MPSLQSVMGSFAWLRPAGVVLGSLAVTLWICCLVLLRAACGRLDRARVDAYCRRWSGWLLRLVRLRLEVQGELPDFHDGRRYLILSSHSSHYDIPVSFVALPGSIRMLAKKELLRVPFLGKAMQAAGFPFIDRRNRYQARADLVAARQLMESGIVLWAAPEGTRSMDGRLLPFKKGCFHLAVDTGAIIVPVAIRGIHRVLPARSWRINLGQAVQLRIGEPIDASRYGAEQMEALMTRTRAQMQTLLEAERVPEKARPRSRPELVLAD